MADFCPQCGTPIESGDKFCNACRAKLSETENIVSPRTRRAWRSIIAGVTLIVVGSGGILYLVWVLIYNLLGIPQAHLAEAGGVPGPVGFGEIAWLIAVVAFSVLLIILGRRLVKRKKGYNG